jgi:hypothetical protein
MCTFTHRISALIFREPLDRIPFYKKPIKTFPSFLPAFLPFFLPSCLPSILSAVLGFELRASCFFA